MTRAEIIAENPIVNYLVVRGYEFRRVGKEMACPCPFHADKSPSFRVNQDKQTWFCDPCGIGGSIIDLVAKFEGISIGDAMKRLDPTSAANAVSARTVTPSARPDEKSIPTQRNGLGKIVAEYDYTDADGNVLYQVVRMEPKDFRQRQKVDGQWKWGMEGAKRVLYKLPQVAKADFVWIVEGEKDADTLQEMGLCGTCNVGGAKKWLPAYNEAIRGKDVILCGDNDETGREHVEKVKAEIAAHANTTRVIAVPADFKDVTDYADTFGSKRDAALALVALAEAAEPLCKGHHVPVYSMEEMEREYSLQVRQSDQNSLDVSRWLPGFRGKVRPVIPGEMAAVFADTGVGKSMIAQNLSVTSGLSTLFFSMELPKALMFERYAAMLTGKSGASVYSSYWAQSRVPWREHAAANRLFVCEKSGIEADEIERIIEIAGLKTGMRPALVVVDYAQLFRGKGDRYERLSNAVEALKVIAKTTKTVVVLLSQVGRKKGEDSGEIFLHDAKDSGSIENSAGLILGAWREPHAKDELQKMVVKLLKNTKGVTAGYRINCRIGDDLTIRQDTEQPEQPEQ